MTHLKSRIANKTTAFAFQFNGHDSSQIANSKQNYGLRISFKNSYDAQRFSFILYAITAIRWICVDGSESGGKDGVD